MIDEAREKCAVFGVFGNVEASWLAYLGLYAMQHRGQEGSGICSADGKSLHVHKGRGLVAEVYSDSMFAQLPGFAAIGHNRYSTTGADIPANYQPILASFRDGQIAIAHNGNLVNARELREECEHLGSIFQSTVDSEVIVHLVARAKPADLEGKILQALSRVKGAYSLICLTPTKLFGIRDPNGFRPLCMGKLGNAWILASESCGIDILGGEYVREVEPGEMVIISESGVESHRVGVETPVTECVFEQIYFARPDSRVFGAPVNDFRVELGAELARESSADADIVMAVPDSSNAAALGFSRQSGLPLEHGLIRNHYVGRTFISPSQTLRDLGVRLKYNVVKSAVEGKRVVVVDDSIVRGTTSRNLMKLIRDAGAKEIHFRVSSPPVRHPCYYGIDMPTYDELIAADRSVEEVRDFIGVDTLAYLSVEGMMRVSRKFPVRGLCHACFTGEYPVKWKKIPQKDGLEVRV